MEYGSRLDYSRLGSGIYRAFPSADASWRQNVTPGTICYHGTATLVLLKAIIFFQVATFIIVDVNLELARHPISVAAVAKPVLVQIHPAGTANLTFGDRYSPWWNTV